MKTWTALVIVAVVAVPLLLAAAAGWVWLTIPPAPDPDALPSSVLAEPSAVWRDAVEEGRSLARAAVAEEKLPGLSLAVAVDGAIVWAEGLRWADLERERPVTPATRFRIGGVSETVAAAAVGLLSERGRLDLDAPVRRYLPDFPDKEWPVSTRQLMAHTGGIRPHRGESGLFQGASCADDSERLALFAAEPLRFRPGSEVAYSTHGWALVGAVVAAVAGEPLHDFVEREILAPLAMESTVPDRAGRSDRASARFYYPRLALDPRLGLQDAPAVDLSCHLAAVGLLATPVDLARFGAAMMGDGLLAPATVAELQTPVRLSSGERTAQAPGWTVDTIALGPAGAPTRIVGRGLEPPVLRQPLSATTVGGQVAGSTAALLTVPEHRVAVAVATNVSGSETVPELATRLADVFVRARPAP